jgi:hypothetical protein
MLKLRTERIGQTSEHQDPRGPELRGKPLQAVAEHVSTALSLKIGDQYPRSDAFDCILEHEHFRPR